MDAHGEVRRWLRAQIEGRDSIKLPLLADQGVAHFASNRAVVKAVYQAAMKELIYQFASDIVRQTRRFEDRLIQVGDDVVSEREFKKQAESLASRWNRWLEYTGIEHRRFMLMQPSELLTAASMREAQIQKDIVCIELFRTVAASLAPSQCVADRFTEQQVEQLLRNIIQNKGERGQNGHLRPEYATVHHLPSHTGVPQPSHGRDT